MGRRTDGEIGGICGYAKTKFEERVEERRKRSQCDRQIETMPLGKLHKPPRVQALHVRTPRTRLRKSIVVATAHQSNLQSASNDLFILEFDPYPFETQTRRFLGAYSTINHVTAGAIKHGAYTFSREGLLDGSEYLSNTGRIRILSLPIIRHGVKVTIQERSRKSNGELVRLDIPHPESQKDATARIATLSADDDVNAMVYLAIRQAADGASCIGVYSQKSLAWGACIKDKSLCACTYSLSDELQSIGLNNMPSVTAKLEGSGRFTWLVESHVVDE